MVALLVLLTLILFLTFDYVSLCRKKRLAADTGVLATDTSSVPPVASVQASPSTSMAPPAGCFLTRTHQWISLMAGGKLRMGLDPLQAQALGDAERVDLPAPGAVVRRGAPLATLHRRGRTLSLLAPVDGRVTSVNETVGVRPRRLSSDPYRTGWLCEMTPASLDLSFLERAFRNRRAETWLAGELRRLRDFLAGGAGPVPVLQDGGLPVNGFGNELDDKQWDRLVQSFFRPGEAPARDDHGEEPWPREY